ncbi:MAG: GTPase ObgE [Candidatus Woesebacteria bacterium]|nr:GTPase ObgE [Candidatus Woesebacteria bacterium]
MLIDIAEVIFKGGDGGGGKISFRKHMKGPDGGNGGDGGNLYVIAKNDLKLLNQFTQEDVFSAGKGVPGSSNQKSGKNGKDLEIFLPVGTSIIDKKSGKEIFDLTKEGERVLICKGGRGGLGNWEFRGDQDNVPKHAEPGQKGEVKELVLSLKIIADFGLIGLPNAGKSSLLNELTGAHEKIANYPFTTLSPALGVFEHRVLADIPGLIEGASTGRGLGIGFLKHIEKVKVLLHCISCETLDVINDYETVRKELGTFNARMLEKKEIILLTKSDLVDEKYLENAKKLLKTKSDQIIGVSINDWTSLQNFKKILLKII